MSPVARTVRSLQWLLPVALLVTAFAKGASVSTASRLPDRLSNAEFWRLSGELSEPGGFFRSDNLVSNEVTWQHPIPELVEKVGTGGVYLGVGPDQNFTYIAALRPRMAIIVDIRRLNVFQHLYYKSLFELSADRAAYLSMLFSRPRPPGLGPNTPPDSLIIAYAEQPGDSALYARNLTTIREHLTKTRGIPLTDDEFAGVEYVADAFFQAGPDLTYNFGPGGRGNRFGGRYMPSYGQLMMETDAQGVPRSYLASEALFGVVKDLQQRNMIVPVTGDFAGDKALRAVGRYLREHDARVSAFYTSNVEQYLFMSETNWRSFFESVGTLPIDDKSTFIRALFNRGWGPSGNSMGPRSITVLCPISKHLAAFRSGTLTSYYDVGQCPAG